MEFHSGLEKVKSLSILGSDRNFIIAPSACTCVIKVQQMITVCFVVEVRWSELIKQNGFPICNAITIIELQSWKLIDVKTSWTVKNINCNNNSDPQNLLTKQTSLYTWDEHMENWCATWTTWKDPSITWNAWKNSEHIQESGICDFPHNRKKPMVVKTQWKHCRPKTQVIRVVLPPRSLESIVKIDLFQWLRDISSRFERKLMSERKKANLWKNIIRFMENEWKYNF